MSTSDTTSTSRAAEKLAERGKNSANNLADAALNAGEELGSAAKVEFDHIMADLQDLVRRAGKLSGQELAVLRQQMSDKLGTAKDKLHHFTEEASTTAHKGVDSAEQMVKDHPLQAVGIAALAGIAIGVLLNRR